MRSLLLILAVLATCLFSTSCLATSSDFDRVSDRVERVEQVLEDETATPEELEEALVELRHELQEGAQRVVERGSALGSDLMEGLAGGGVMGGLSAALMYLVRQGQRRKRGEPTTPAEARLQREQLEERLLVRLRQERE